MKKFVAGLAVCVAALGMTIGTASGATSLGGRTLDAEEPTLTGAYVTGLAYIYGNSGQQTIQIRMLKDGIPTHSTPTNITIPAGYINKKFGSIAACLGSNSVWVMQTKFLSQTKWDSSAGKRIAC
jgi:hypothetical protein